MRLQQGMLNSESTERCNVIPRNTISCSGIILFSARRIEMKRLGILGRGASDIRASTIG